MSEGDPIHTTAEILSLTDDEIEQMEGLTLRSYLLSILQDNHPNSPKLASISEKLNQRAESL